MFYPTQSPTVWAAVEGVETAESGRKVEFSFDIKVKRITFPELQALYARAAEEGLTDYEAIKDLVLDWRKVGTPEEGPTPFSTEGLQQFMAALGGAPFIRALNRVMPKAKEKN